MKKFISILLTIMIVVPIFSNSINLVHAEKTVAQASNELSNMQSIVSFSKNYLSSSQKTQINDFEYDVISQTDVEITGYFGLDSIVEIPSTINGYIVTSIGADAFNSCSSLTSITIPDSVTSIEDHAFYCCTNLTSITIPDSVTSIGESAFAVCSSLTSIKVDDNNMYYDSRDNCNALIETSTNTLIGGCKNTVIPNSVTSIASSAFRNCTNLTSITIPDSVTNIGKSVFTNCTSLTSITIPDSVTSIGYYAFMGCINLTSIKVDDNNMYYDSRDNCNALIETSTNTLVEGCKNTVIPDSVTSIDKYAFRDCTSLESITIPNSVTSIGDHAFYSCTSLTSITIPDSVTSIGHSVFSKCTSLTSITIPDSVTSIGYYVFSACKNLTIYGFKDSYAQSYANNNNIPFVVIAEMPTTPTDPVVTKLLGDVNLDEDINITDVTTIQMHIAKLVTLENYAIGLADTNGDSDVTITDVTHLQMFIAKLIDEL